MLGQIKPQKEQLTRYAHIQLSLQPTLRSLDNRKDRQLHPLPLNTQSHPTPPPQLLQHHPPSIITCNLLCIPPNNISIFMSFNPLCTRRNIPFHARFLPRTNPCCSFEN